MREGTDGVREGTDDMRERNDAIDETIDKEYFERLAIKVSKVIGEIKLCGFLRISIFEDDENFIRPTKEQIKNLHDMLCIDIVMFDEESED